MKIGILKIGIRSGICCGLLIVMMLIGNTRFPAGREITSRIIDEDWVAAGAPSATTWADTRRTMVPLAATDKSQVVKANERIQVDRKMLSEVLATLNKLINLSQGLGIAPIGNTRAS